MDVVIKPMFGHVQIVPTRRWVGDELVLGGYAIHYDENGVERYRTEDTENGRMRFPEEKKWWWPWMS